MIDRPEPIDRHQFTVRQHIQRHRRWPRGVAQQEVAKNST